MTSNCTAPSWEWDEGEVREVFETFRTSVTREIDEIRRWLARAPR